MQAIEGTRQRNGSITNVSEQKDARGRPKFAESIAPQTEARRESGDRRFSGNFKQGAQLSTVAEERAAASPGKVVPGGGHAHFDVTGNQSPDFSQNRDMTSARHGQIIAKVNESNPGKVTRLTPQTDGSEPKERPIEPPKADPRQGKNGDVPHSGPDGMPDVQGASTLLSSAGQ